MLQKFLDKLAAHSAIRFMIEMTALVYVVKIIGSIVVVSIVVKFPTILSWLLRSQLTVDTQPSHQILASSLFTGLLLAPVTETIMAQTLGSFLLVKKPYLAVIFSTFIFTYFHWVKHLPIIGAFFVGLVLSFAYVFTIRHSNITRAILITSIIHSLHNLTAIMLQLYILRYR